jgi:hypothetical protein
VNEALSQLPATQQAVVDIAAKNGVHVDIAQLQEQVALLTPARVAEAAAYLKSIGTEAFFDRVLNTFETAAKRPALPVSGERSALEEGMCGSLAAIAATLWILSAAYALGCAATLGVCLVCCVASAILGIAAGVVNLIEVVVC